MNLYKIVYCFIDKNGNIESDEFSEVYHKNYICSNSKEDAIIQLAIQEQFVQEPEIVEIKLVKSIFLFNISQGTAKQGYHNWAVFIDKQGAYILTREKKIYLNTENSVII